VRDFVSWYCHRSETTSSSTDTLRSDDDQMRNELTIPHEIRDLDSYSYFRLPYLAPQLEFNAAHGGSPDPNCALNSLASPSRSSKHCLRAKTELTVTHPTSTSLHTLITPGPKGDLDNPVFRCNYPECLGKTFGRRYELQRHYNGAHSESPTVYWCTMVGCERSEAEGGRPFPRKDKRNDHARNIHGV
jgi:hypothetical protein